MNKIKNFINKTNNKISKVTVAAASALVLTTTKAFASAANIIQNLLGYVFGIFFYIGILLLAWGIGQLVLAFKNEDGDSKSRAILVITASVLLMAIGTIFDGLGLGIQSGGAKTDF